MHTTQPPGGEATLAFDMALTEGLPWNLVDYSLLRGAVYGIAFWDAARSEEALTLGRRWQEHINLASPDFRAINGGPEPDRYINLAAPQVEIAKVAVDAYLERSSEWATPYYAAAKIGVPQLDKFIALHLVAQ